MEEEVYDSRTRYKIEETRQFRIVAVSVVLIALVLVGIVAYMVQQNSELQKHYNDSLVACVAKGGDPLSCQVALQTKR